MIKTILSYAIAIMVMALLFMMVLLSPAFPASLCGDRAALADAVGVRHNETLCAIGRTVSNDEIHIYASPTGSWSMIMTKPNGRSCIIAVGVLIDEVWF